MIVSALGKSINQLSDPKFKKVFFKTAILSTISLLTLSTIFTYFFLFAWSSFGLPFGSIISGIGGIIFFFIGMWVFGPIIAIIFNEIFLDEIIIAVESRYYSNLKIDVKNKIFKEIKFNLRLLFNLILLNLLILPFIFFPPIYFVLYWLVNGYLISYEYFTIIKIRYNNQNYNFSKKKYVLFTFGTIISILFTVPVINFFVPAIGIATAVHIYREIVSDK